MAHDNRRKELHVHASRLCDTCVVVRMRSIYLFSDPLQLRGGYLSRESEALWLAGNLLYQCVSEAASQGEQVQRCMRLVPHTLEGLLVVETDN